MAIRFFNTLTRSKDVFEPLVSGKAGMYTCGPTIYNFAHIGNFRAYVAQDVLKRHLCYRGYAVTHVMNLTDVEDKIIRACRETGESLKSLTGRYAQAFFDDLKTLGIVPADHYPAATDHIPEMVEMIKALREKGFTYEHEGSVYFRLGSFPGYGKLSHFDMDTLQSGGSGRVDTDEYDRENIRDFALWKGWDEDDGPIFWETELGKGRPGWHIECSVMSMKYLGPSFDIHCGGEDLVFPHHENEIAQSECATGQPFARYWLHNAYLIVENRKMSKSLGNFFTLRDLLEKGYDPMAIRWVLLATHYRMPNNFTFEAVDAAKESLRRIRDFRARLAGIKNPEGNALEDAAIACETAFGDAMDDDLNISAALAAVFDFVRDVNRLIDRDEVSAQGATRAQELLDRLDSVTGLFAGPTGEQVPDEIMALVRERAEARRARQFARADAIRDSLAAQGWVLEDTPDGARVKRG